MSDELWIEVAGWQRFQHYRDRNPPWVKLYTQLQHDDNWISLTPHRRAMLVGIWLEYASSSCAVRAHTRRLSRALHMQVTRSDLKALNDAGFIHFAASKPLAPRARSRETEAEKEKSRSREARYEELETLGREFETWTRP